MIDIIEPNESSIYRTPIHIRIAFAIETFVDDGKGDLPGPECKRSSPCW